MSVPVEYEERLRHRTPTIGTDELNALLYDRPALRLAGEDTDEDESSEPHIWRGID